MPLYSKYIWDGGAFQQGRVGAFAFVFAPYIANNRVQCHVVRV